MSYKILVIKTDSCDEYDEPEIHIQELNAVDLANSQDFSLREAAVSLALKLFESQDEYFLRLLHQRGWINIKNIKERAEKLEAEKKYWIQQEGRLYPIDFENIPIHTVCLLADDNIQVLQSISKPSLKKIFNQSQRKAYDSEVVKIKNNKLAKVLNTKLRAEKKRKREIEKAKKLLAELEGKDS
jgi:hypothetical protein